MIHYKSYTLQSCGKYQCWNHDQGQNQGMMSQTVTQSHRSYGLVYLQRRCPWSSSTSPYWNTIAAPSSQPAQLPIQWPKFWTPHLSHSCALSAIQLRTANFEYEVQWQRSLFHHILEGFDEPYVPANHQLQKKGQGPPSMHPWPLQESQFASAVGFWHPPTLFKKWMIVTVWSWAQRGVEITIWCL